MIKSTRVNNWSRYPVIDTQLHSFRTSDELREFLTTTPKFIARGSGLSYGDASLAPVILSTLHFNKMLYFDKQQGIIRCESGVTLDEILKVTVPAGWFLPVAPGTKFITLGGAIASDIHGKNHHKEGSITQYVTALTLMVYNGEIIACSPTENPDVFHSTCGGMGLSGVIMDIEIKLKRIQTSYIAQKNIIAPDLHSLIKILKDNASYTYSVSWIDCISTGSKMGRGVVMLGEHATREDLHHKLRRDPLRVHKDPKVSVPFDMPSFVLNQFSIGLFNRLFYAKHVLSAKEFMIHYDKFFFPLDFIRDWNRLYGHRGLLQYQFVIPFEDGEKTMTEILKGISKSKLASFLSVLKLLSHGEHTLSFPMAGFTLALDFPISDELFELLDELDHIVSSNGGRLYLAKDVRMKLETFAKGYPDAEKFSIAVRNTSNSWKFESLLSKRLSITK